jgi:hypothetical protein
MRRPTKAAKPTYPPFAVSKGDISWFCRPYSILLSPDEDKSLNRNILDSVIVNTSNFGGIHVNIAFCKPTKVVSTASVAALDAHVGTEWKRRLNLKALQIEIEI